MEASCLVDNEDAPAPQVLDMPFEWDINEDGTTDFTFDQAVIQAFGGGGSCVEIYFVEK